MAQPRPYQVHTCGRARAGAADLRRLCEMLRAAPWRTPPELALQGALGDSTSELAVLRRERRVGDPTSFCTMACTPQHATFVRRSVPNYMSNSAILDISAWHI